MHQRYRFHQMDVFTDKPYQGNPVAVDQSFRNDFPVTAD
jgi:predicted PhzF superfamily epimerase YddE/YHI9